MTPYELIQLYKDKKGLQSDYAASKELGITRAAVSMIKSGGGFGVETAWRIAETLDMNLAEVIATCEIASAERSRKDELAAVWKQRLEKVSHSPLTGFFAIALAGASKLSEQVCILCSIDHRGTQRATWGF